MRQVTTIIGALFVFSAVFLVADFIVTRAFESAPDWVLLLGMAAAALTACFPAAASYKASLRHPGSNRPA
jgi:hypothetical protein